MANDPSYLPYSPQTTNAQTIHPVLLPANNVHTVRITWIDLINNIRFRAVPLSSFQRLLASSRPGVMIAQGAFGIAGITLAPGFGPVGEYFYVLDLSTIRLCSYAPGHASIVGWLQDMTPAPGRVLGTGVPMCPRSVLKRVIEYKFSSLFECRLMWAFIAQQHATTQCFWLELKVNSSSSKTRTLSSPSTYMGIPTRGR
jgi:hypothetical protein